MLLSSFLAYIIIRKTKLESSFLDLRCKEVVNIVDGTRLGHIIDVVIILSTGQISGLVVPGNKSIFSFLKGGNELFIPFSQVCKIGEDAILVELYGVNNPISTYSYRGNNSRILNSPPPNNPQH